MSKNKTQTISVSTLIKSYYEYKISCYLITYPRIFIYVLDTSGWQALYYVQGKHYAVKPTIA